MAKVLTDAQKQTKLRSGIQPLQIIMNTNYLAKSQFPLTSDLFEFPYLTDKPSNLEKYPLISTNVKYDDSRIRFLTHVERFQIVFSMPRLLQFISDLPIEDESQKSDVLKHNTEFMLEMLFPISYPVIKKLKMASKNEFSISLVDAIVKEAAYQKFNTYLKLDGKSCTVDEIRFMDTFGANPIYVKLYDLAKDYFVRRDAAIIVLRADINTRLNEFKTELGKKMKDSLKGITGEIMKMYNSNSTVNVDKTKMIAEKNTCDGELADIKKQKTALEHLEVAQKELLRYNRGTGAGYTSVKNTIETHLSKHHKEIFPGKRVPSIIIDQDFKQANAAIATIDVHIKELEKEKTSKPKITDNIDLLIDGYTKLIEYIKQLNNVRDAFKINPKGPIGVLFNKIDKLTDLQKEVSRLQYEDKEKSKDCAEIQKKIDSLKMVDLAFISSAAPTDAAIETAFANSANDPAFKRLQSGNSVLSALIPDYTFMKQTLLDDGHTSIVSSLLALDVEIANPSTPTGNINPVEIKTMKDKIKSMYDSNQSYFSQRNPLTEAFMKLRKICGFAYLITSMHQYQENLNIEREYSINYNIDADLKKGEYLFHKTIAESLRAYYYPNRQSMEPAIKTIVSVKDTEPINMDAIVTLFENNSNTPAAIDLVDLGGKPRYECQCSIYLVGGIITPENSSKIDCSYQDRITGANLLKERFKLIVPEFTDLTQHIAEMEKKYGIKYEKKKLEDYSLGSAVLTAGPPGLGGPGPIPGPMPTGPAPPMPPPAPKKAAISVSDADLERIIGSHMPNGSSTTFLKDFIKTKGYEKVKEFLETAVNYERTKPNPIDYVDATNKTTHKEFYENNKIDAESTIDREIKKKTKEMAKTTLTSTETGMLGREISMLKALQAVVDGVDKMFDKMWSSRGGKKTRKHRRKRSKKTRRHKSK